MSENNVEPPSDDRPREETPAKPVLMDRLRDHIFVVVVICCTASGGVIFTASRIVCNYEKKMALDRKELDFSLRHQRLLIVEDRYRLLETANEVAKKDHDLHLKEAKFEYREQCGSTVELKQKNRVLDARVRFLTMSEDLSWEAARLFISAAPEEIDSDYCDKTQNCTGICRVIEMGSEWFQGDLSLGNHVLLTYQTSWDQKILLLPKTVSEYCRRARQSDGNASSAVAP